MGFELINDGVCGGATAPGMRSNVGLHCHFIVPSGRRTAMLLPPDLVAKGEAGQLISGDYDIFYR